MSDTTITELELTNFTTSDDFMVLDRGNKTYKINPSNIGGLNVDSTIYVSIDGSDELNTGKTSISPFKTIKKACKFANDNFPKKYTILVYAGEYLEENPIVLPENTALIGNDSRTVVIKPKNTTYDILWVNNSCYVYGITFKDYNEPSSAITFPKYETFDDEFNKAYNTLDLEIIVPTDRPIITNSPYIRECNSNTKGFTFPLQNLKTQVYNLSLSANTQTTNWINSLYNTISSITLDGPDGFPFIIPNINSTIPAFEDLVDYFRQRILDYDNQFDYYNINNAFTTYGISLSTESLSSNFFRDVRLILNSLLFDLSANTNRLASDVATNYYDSVSSLMLPFNGYSTKNAVLSGLDKLYLEIRDDVFIGVPTPYASNTIPFFVTKEFDIIKNSINTLTTVYSPLTASPTSFKNTALLLSSNSEFIQEELYYYLSYNYFGFLNDNDLLDFKQDTKEFVKAIVNDLNQGSNSKTSNYSYYYYDKIKNIIPSRTNLSLDVFDHLSKLIYNITQNQSISGLSYGCGTAAKVDGSLVEGYFRNMTFESFSQLNQGGKGIWITNNGQAQITNSDSKCCSESILCESGGTCYVDASHTSFGLSGLVAKGYSPLPVLSAITYGSFTSNDNIVNVNSIKGLSIYDTNIGDGSILRAPHQGLKVEFRIDNNPLSSVYLPITIQPYLLGINNYRLLFSNNLPKTIPSGTPVYFYIRSLIRANSHTFESVGSGSFLQRSTPALGGISNSNLEICFDSNDQNFNGLVYSSSLNQIGDFKHGDVLKISDNTNTISIFGKLGINTEFPNTDLTVNGSISSSNNLFSNNLFLSSNGIVGKNLTVYGSTSTVNNLFSNNLYLSSNGIVGKDLTVYGSTSTVNNLFSNNLYLSSNGIVGKDLTVYGSISSSNNLFSNNLFLSSNGIVGKDLTVYGSTSTVNNLFSNNLYLSSNGIVGKDLTVYGKISAANGIAGTLDFLNVTGDFKTDGNIFAKNLYLSGSGTVKNDLTIQGNLSVVGAYLFPPPTIGFASSALFLENIGSTLVLRATQLGINQSDIADFRNSSTSVLYISTGGVGIFNQTPQYELDVNGNIAASNEFIYNSTERPDLTGVKQALNELFYYTKGGLLIVDSLSSLSSVPVVNQKVGMLIYIDENSSYYKLTSINDPLTGGYILFPPEIPPLNYLPLSGGIVDGNVSILSSLEVGIGNAVLFVSGNKVGINTETPNAELTVNGNVSILSSLEVGFGNTTLFVSGDKVGINTEIPNVELTVNGEISSSNVIYDASGNSTQWNSVYSSVQTNSAVWDDTSTIVHTNSSLWEYYDFKYKGSFIYSTSTPPVYNIKDVVINDKLVYDNLFNELNTPDGNIYLCIKPLPNIYGAPAPIDSTGTPQTEYWKLLEVDSELLKLAVPTYTIVNNNSSNWNSVYTTVSSASSTWDSVYTSVNGVSGNWNSVYTTVSSASSTWDYTYTNQKNYLPLSGGTVTGDTQFNNNVTVWGKLSAIGGTYFADTVYTTTSALSVYHVGNGPALWVGSIGTGDIASFYDADQNIEMLHIGGHDGAYPNVGVKTSTPNVDFTVNGEISASEIIYDASGNSTQWNSVYTSVNGVSGNWDSVYTTVSSASSTWTITNNITADLNVGAITAGQVFDIGTTFQVFAEKLITKVFYPTFTLPSATLTSNLASIVESGTTGITLTVNLNKGLITGKSLNGIWQPTLFQNNRSGDATKYTIFGIDNGTTTFYTSANAIINDGANSFTATVDYGTGPQPVDSKDNNFNSPLAAGSISPSLTITGRRRAFYGINSAGSNSTEIRNLSSVLNPQNDTTFTISLPIGTTSIVFAYPASLRDVTEVRESVLNSDVKAAFGTPYNVNVFGNNNYTAISYKVYRFQPPNPIATPNYSYKVTI